MFGEKVLDGFQFDDDFAETDQIRNVDFFEKAAFVADLMIGI